MSRREILSVTSAVLCKYPIYNKEKAVMSRIVLLSLFAVVLAAGCSKSEKSGPEAVAASPEYPSLSVEELTKNPDLFQQRLKETNPAYRGGALIANNPQLGLVGQINVATVSDISGLQGIPFNAIDLRNTPVSDISPLAGRPLKMLGLENTRVTDLSALNGMKLEKLYLNGTAVSDLRPLAGVPLLELMLVKTKVQDLTPLKGAPLTSLWVNDTQVSDIAPVAGCPLMSLTLANTPVSDISPLEGHATLERLHIGGTKVVDLSPLKGIKLGRLIFTPSSEMKGLDVVRGMKSMKEMGATLERRMPPDRFWARYDASSK